MRRSGGRHSTRATLGWIGPSLLLLFAVVFWVFFLGQAERSVFGRVPILDEVYYLDQAAAWKSGPVPPPDSFFVSPLYPILIALAGAGEGVPDDRVLDAGQLRTVRVFQMICWLGVVVLLRMMAGRLYNGNSRPGWRTDLVLWLPALLFALYRPAAVYTVSILLEMPLLLLMTAAIHLMTRMKDEWGPRAWLGLMLGTGLAIGLAGLLRGTALLLVIPAVVLGCRHRSASGGRWGGPLVLVAAIVLVMTPAILHNSRIAGRLAGPTHNGGVNLFIGNGPEANGFYVAMVPGDWRLDPAGRAYLGQRMGTAKPSLAEADRIWSREAVRSMGENPVRTAGLWAKKVWLHLQGWEIDQLTPLDRWRRAAPALNGLPVPFALLVILGFGGAAGRWRDTRVRWLLVFAAVLVAGQSAFFVVSRYRLALVPVLCLLSVAGAVEILRGNRRAVAAAVLGILVTIPWGLGETRDLWRAQALSNEALRWAEVGLVDASPSALRRAEDLYREALEGLSGNDGGPAPWLGLAALLAERGAKEEAAEILAEGARRSAGNLEINKTLLSLRLEAGQRNEALELTESILAGHPRDADTLHNRTILLFESGRMEDAVASARSLVEAHPADARGYVDLGIILARAGRPGEARAVFEAGLQAVPGNSALQRNLELLDR